MPNIDRINEQLLRIAHEINSNTLTFGALNLEKAELRAKTIESLCKAQRVLVETQIMIFVECTESDIDMPTLPLFVEERDESNSG